MKLFNKVSRFRIISMITIMTVLIFIAACDSDNDNEIPKASNLAVTTSQGESVDITLSGVDADGDALTYTATSQPGKGSLSGDAPNLTYTPGSSFSGSDSFTYTVSDGTATSNTATVTITEKTTDIDITLSVSAHPENTLMAVAQVTTSAEASVAIEFTSAATATHQTQASDTGTTHNITVIGMRAETPYTMTAVVTLSNGVTARSNAVSFTTGSIPVSIPEINVTAATTDSEGGITFFGTGLGQDTSVAKMYWGVDEQGEIVWYLHGDYQIVGTPSIRSIEPGVLMVFLQNAVRTITTTGETIAEFSLGMYHHDAILLSNGNILMLTSEVTDNSEGTNITSDKIIEKNADGQTVWEWSSFDHLDTTRFPGALSTTESPQSGALDWSHSNSLFYVEDEDTIIVSVRSQSWVIKIDHSTGNIVWIMGESTDTVADYQYSDKFFTLESGSWMGNQHAAMVTASGEILMFDNRNETGGSTAMSRAVKYSLDLSAMTANQTWEAIAPKYSGSLGDADELIAGNVLMVAGGPGTDTYAHIVEAKSDASGDAVWSITVDTNIYRAERMSWDGFLNTGNSSVPDDGDDDSDDDGTPPLSYVVVDTGQTSCYGYGIDTMACPDEYEELYGQDGMYNGLQPSYQDNEDGTITDLNTGLVWQSVPSGNMGWAYAFDYAEGLDLGGYTDWRVPTIKELYSLAQFYGNLFKGIPYIDTDYFTIEGTSNGRVWSSNEYVGTTMMNDDSAFGFNFGDGRIKSYPYGINDSSSSGPCSVLCVRGGNNYGTNDFVDNGDNTVTDRATGLMWMKGDSGTTMKWEPAMAYAESLEYAGYSDWRLPNTKELHTLVDYSKAPDANDPTAVGPAIDTSIFELTETESWYWSSTTLTDNGHGIYICFGQAFGYNETAEDFTKNVHGAGAQRSDPKQGEPEDYPGGLGTDNQNDQVRIYNYVRCVRDAN